MKSESNTTKFKDEELEIHGKFEQDKIKEQYDHLSKNYEEVYLEVGYPDPEKCAEFVESFEISKDDEILDMGCGTGLVGKFLKEKGYTQIIGIDASTNMIEKAQEKDCYAMFEEMFLGKPDTFPEKFHDRFNVLTAAGILAEGHLGNEVFDEMILALKQDGIAIFTTREEYLTKYRYQEKMDELVEQGKWEFVKQEEFMRYNNMKGEGVGRFKPTKVLCIAYKKL
jgi:predicted TPR repeat methyltransferase